MGFYSAEEGVGWGWGLVGCFRVVEWFLARGRELVRHLTQVRDKRIVDKGRIVCHNVYTHLWCVRWIPVSLSIPLFAEDVFGFEI